MENMVSPGGTHRPGTPQAHGVSFADTQRRQAFRDEMARKALAAQVDCEPCSGSGENVQRGKCQDCNGQGYTSPALPALGRKHIKADGTEVVLDTPISIRQVSALIGADTLDTVNLRDARRHVMLIDDCFMGKGLPVNEKATALYWSVCNPGTTHQIRGDVVIVPDADFGGPGL